jgi:hypothetical protein
MPNKAPLVITLDPNIRCNIPAIAVAAAAAIK